MDIKNIYLAIICLNGYVVCQQCCDTGHYLIQNKTISKLLCNDPDTNTTSDINLQCSTEYEINLINLMNNHYNCSLIDDGNLSCKTRPNRGLYIKPYSNGTFCFGSRKIFTKKGTLTPKFVAVCIKPPVPSAISSQIRAFCMIVTVVFLILTVLVYAAMPELRDLEGLSICNLCGSMALGLGIFSISLLVTPTIKICAAEGFLAHYFIIVAFFWMNVTSYQILNCVRQSIIRPYAKKEFLWYVLYAWGFPALFTMATIIVNYVEGEHYRPGIGINGCWFHDNIQRWIYFYSVILLIIVVNLGIFIYTSVYLWKTSFKSNNIAALRYKFHLSLRMIVVMGLPWIFEMLSSLFDSHIVWDILDTFNLMFGLLVFLMMAVFRRRTIKALYRNGWLTCCAGPLERYLATAEDCEDLNGQHTAVVQLEGMEK